MATLSLTKICLFWFRIVASPTLEQTSWNGNSHADPDTLTGGIAFNQGGCLTDPLYLTATGTGDAGVVAKFQPPFTSPPIWLPKTYGLWPADDSGHARFDDTNLQGSAALTNPARTSVSFIATPGAAQTTTGILAGRYFAEYQVTYDIFSSRTGMGIIRHNAELAQLTSGRFSVADAFGGAMVQGGDLGTVPTYQTSLDVFGSTLAGSNVVSAPGNTVLAIAMAVIPQYNYVPNLISAVSMPRLICCPVQRNRGLARLLRNRKGQP